MSPPAPSNTTVLPSGCSPATKRPGSRRTPGARSSAAATVVASKAMAKQDTIRRSIGVLRLGLCGEPRTTGAARHLPFVPARRRACGKAWRRRAGRRRRTIRVPVPRMPRMTIVVHHLDNSRSQRVLWLLEELGLPYEIVAYRRDPRTLLAPDALRRVHPLGKAPVVVDG